MNPLAAYSVICAVAGGAIIAGFVLAVCLAQLLPARPKGNRHHD